VKRIDDSSIGRVEAIWLKRAHRGPMDLVAEATLIAGRGLEGSVDRSRRRQVSIVEHESWSRALNEVNASADPVRRRANILVRGIALAHTRGKVLLIGAAELMIGGELTPCERMEEVAPGLQAAMRPDWRGGVFAQVITGGVIRIGDPITWQSIDDQND
jgi:MOSC domain-containing protein YiiM